VFGNHDALGTHPVQQRQTTRLEFRGRYSFHIEDYSRTRKGFLVTKTGHSGMREAVRSSSAITFSAAGVILVSGRTPPALAHGDDLAVHKRSSG
jgi:hypothetical protein